MARSASFEFPPTSPVGKSRNFKLCPGWWNTHFPGWAADSSRRRGQVNAFFSRPGRGALRRGRRHTIGPRAPARGWLRGPCRGGRARLARWRTTPPATAPRIDRGGAGGRRSAIADGWRCCVGCDLRGVPHGGLGPTHAQPASCDQGVNADGTARAPSGESGRPRRRGDDERVPLRQLVRRDSSLARRARMTRHAAVRQHLLLAAARRARSASGRPRASPRTGSTRPE